MKIVDATEIVLELAAQQWGLVTSAQAGIEGVSPVMLSRLVDKAVLTRIRSGVYAAEATPWSPATSIRAQWLALEPKTMAADRTSGDPLAVVSHESAAELYGIGDLDSNGIHFTVGTRRQTRQPEVIFHFNLLDKQDWEMLDGLPVTTPIRTVIDLANAGHEPDHLIDMIGDILQERLVPRSKVIDGLAGNAQMIGHHFGSKDAVESWLGERFPAAVTPAEQILRQQVNASLAPTLEKMNSLLERIAPSVKMMSLAEEIIRNFTFHSEINKSLPEAFRSEEWRSAAAKMLEHDGTFPEPSQPWAETGSELGQLSTPPRRPEEPSRTEDDDDTEDHQ